MILSELRKTGVFCMTLVDAQAMFAAVEPAVDDSKYIVKSILLMKTSRTCERRNLKPRPAGEETAFGNWSSCDGISRRNAKA